MSSLLQISDTHFGTEQPAVLQALFGASGPSLDQVFDGLADFVDTHFQPGALQALIR